MKSKHSIRTFGVWFCWFVLCLAASSAIAEWKGPIGIPNPGFYVEETRPARPNPWTEPVAHYYFVNAQAGVDAGRQFGTPGSPRKTIPKGLGPGSYVEVAGKYDLTSGGITDLFATGSSGPWQAGVSGPVWIVGSQSSEALFTMRTVVRGTHFYLDNLNFRLGGRVQIGSLSGTLGATNIAIANCRFIGDSWSLMNGLAVVGGTTNYSTRIALFNNFLTGWGNVTTNVDQDATPIVVEGPCRDVWGIQNVMEESSGPGVRVGGAFASQGPGWCENVYFGSNVVARTRQAGLAVKYATDVVFSQNDISNIVDTAWSPSKGIGAQYAPKGLWILFNRIRGQRYGIKVASTDSGGLWPIYAIGNVIYDCHFNPANGPYGGGSWDEAGIQMQGGTSRFIINNTIFNCDAGINLSGSGEFVLENNIVANVTQDRGNHIYIEKAVDTTTLRSSLLYQISGLERIKNGSQLQTASQYGHGLLASDPMFVNSASANFALKGLSPAMGTGLTLNQLTQNIYQQFMDRFGIPIDVDFYGRKLPATRSMGAIEGAPPPPQNLRVTSAP